MLINVLGFVSLFLFAPFPAAPSAVPAGGDAVCQVVDDFESYPVDGLPTRWATNKGSRQLKRVSPAMVDENERFVILQEGGNKFVRAMMRDQAHRLVQRTGEEFEWSLQRTPFLRWDWRAVDLPEGAREDKEELNDTGAAVYVTFGKDWLGRPISIKYSYSSTLPVGTVVSYGSLKILVVASAKQGGTGRWATVTRNVREDYKNLFGKDATDTPAGIMLWSDSDSRNTTSVADFDNVMLLSSRQAHGCGAGGGALTRSNGTSERGSR